jgi:hypothetical protein
VALVALVMEGEDACCCGQGWSFVCVAKNATDAMLDDAVQMLSAEGAGVSAELMIT